MGFKVLQCIVYFESDIVFSVFMLILFNYAILLHSTWVREFYGLHSKKNNRYLCGKQSNFMDEDNIIEYDDKKQFHTA